MDFVCFASAYWYDPLWTNKQHIMSRFAGRGHRVLFVPPGTSRRILRAWLRGDDPFNALWRWIRPERENLWRMVPLPLPLRQFEILKPLAWGLLARAVRSFLAHQGWDQPILWIYHPEAARILDRIPARLVCYDCVDDFRTFPQYRNRQEAIAALEERILRRADLVFATSPALCEAKRLLNPNTHLVPNVGDAEHFGKALLPETKVPDDLARIPPPRIGFVGAVDDYKVDVGLLAQVAGARPEWSFALIGPVGVAEKQSRLQPLRLPNVHLLGYRPYEMLPNYLKGMDVCIIPYAVTEHTASVFPIKFFEFLASGKPVVVTPLPSLLPFRGAARIAEGAEAFVQAIAESLERDTAEAKEVRLALARANTWDKRVDTLLSLVQDKIGTTNERK